MGFIEFSTKNIKLPANFTYENESEDSQIKDQAVLRD